MSSDPGAPEGAQTPARPHDPGDDYYRRTLDGLIEGVQIISHDWIYLYVNPAAATHGRRSRDELLGRKMWDVYPGIEDTPTFALLKRCMAEGRNAAVQNLFTFPDDSASWFELRIHPVPDGLCIISVDIQERKLTEARLQEKASALEAKVAARTHELELANEQLEARVAQQTAELRDANEQLRSIIDSAVDGIIVVDTRGRIEGFNPGAARLFGYTEQEVLGRNVTMLMPSPDREHHDAYLTRYLAGGPPQVIGRGREVVGLRRDGSTFPLHLSVGEMSIRGERRFTGILHDLTERALLERKLRDQATLAQLGEMAAVLAHEVKNPIAGVRGAIEVIGGRLPPDSRDAAVLREVVARLDSLSELMRDLLVFARPREPRPGPLDMAALLERVAALVKQDPAHRDLRIELTGSLPTMIADGELLGIIFQNLMLNAAHAIESNGSISVTISSTDGMCHVTIADSGPGIPPEVKAKLFTPFFTTKSRGTGLGLATARRFVEAHKGTIAVECPEGGGTAVTVSLPIEQRS